MLNLFLYSLMFLIYIHSLYFDILDNTYLYVFTDDSNIDLTYDGISQRYSLQNTFITYTHLLNEAYLQLRIVLIKYNINLNIAY